VVRLLALLPLAVALAACKPSSSENAKGVTVDLPPALPVEAGNVTDTSQNAVAEVPLKEPTEELAPPAKPEPKVEEPEPPRPEAKAPKPPEAAKPEPAPAVAPEPEAAPTEKPKPTSVKLPLSNDRIASTIQRIGYACGSVSSIDEVDGSDTEKAYKITCSSGDTYRGTNRSGHMRFRKWGS
jgi:outer membrane biosynthesis protein TonB